MATFDQSAIFYILFPGDTKERGPHTLKELRGMWQEGTIKGDTLYAHDGMKEWRELRTIQEQMSETREIRCDYCSHRFLGLTDVPVLNQPCPMCKHPPVKMGSESPALLFSKQSDPRSALQDRAAAVPLWSGVVGSIMIVLGFLGMFVFTFAFETSVASDGQRVVNIGLSNDRLVGIVASSGVAVMGAIFVAAHTLMETVVSVMVKTQTPR